MMGARALVFLSITAFTAWIASTVHGAVFNISTNSALQAAFDKAVAGDEIVLADGVYSGVFYIRNNAGTSSNPITVRAANRHKAILQNSKMCNQTSGLSVSRQHWIIDGLYFQNHGRVMSVTASNVTVRNSILTNFGGDGIRAAGPLSGVRIENNVIGHGDSCHSNDGHGLIFITSVTNSQMKGNIIFATGDNGYQADDKSGYGILVANNSNDNLIQGNTLFANGGKGTLRLLAGCTVTVDRNLVRDNVFLWGEGGAAASGDCGDDSNDFSNNLIVGAYHVGTTTKGNSDGNRGRHKFLHNTIIKTEFSRMAHASGSASTGVKKNMVFRDNLTYANHAQSGNGGGVIFYNDNQNVEYPSSLNPGYNLFWAPSSQSTWFRNYTPRPQDVLAQPIFVDPARGDYTLAPGSPGKNAASGGTDVGIAYNSFLRKELIAKAFALETQQHNDLKTSTSFTVSPNHFYQVYFYIPVSGACALTNEVFTVEGQNLGRNISYLTTATWTNTTQRWITLGRHKATDGTLNVSWTTSSCADKIFIRKLPTVEEAYAWTVTGAIEGPGPSPSPSPSPSPDLAIPGRMEAESFNAGGEGVSYHDTTSANLGGAYRTSEGVDIKLAPGGKGYTIGYINAGEWLRYDVDVAQTGQYSTTFRTANGAATNGALRVEVNGVNVTGTITIPPTGSYSIETTVTGPTISLNQGVHTLRLYMEVGNFDLNWLEFTASSGNLVPAAPTNVTAVAE